MAVGAIVRASAGAKSQFRRPKNRNIDSIVKFGLYWRRILRYYSDTNKGGVFLDLDEMIHNLEVERQRIDEALHVLRRLNRTRNSSRLAASNEGKREGMPEVEGDENDLPLTSGDDSKSS